MLFWCCVDIFLTEVKNILHNNILITLTAPLGGILTRLISIRKVQFLGMLLSILGVGLCTFATELYHVILLFGIVAGRHSLLQTKFVSHRLMSTHNKLPLLARNFTGPEGTSNTRQNN